MRGGAPSSLFIHLPPKAIISVEQPKGLSPDFMLCCYVSINPQCQHQCSKNFKIPNFLLLLLFGSFSTLSCVFCVCLDSCWLRERPRGPWAKTEDGGCVPVVVSPVAVDKRSHPFPHLSLGENTPHPAVGSTRLGVNLSGFARAPSPTSSQILSNLLNAPP